MKTISISLIIIFAFSLSAEGRMLDTKTVGKLTMIAVLSATAYVVRMLINRDQDKTARLREQLGSPDKSIEFQEGFDHLRVEWYGGRAYIFRNGVLYRQHRRENDI